MARVNVNSQIVDESAVIPAQEGPSSLIAGYLDTELYPNNMLGSLGFTHEREQGYMTISSVGEWHERLKTNQPTGYDFLYENSDLGQVEIYPFFHNEGIKNVAGNTYAGATFERWPSGPGVKVEWEYDFALIENYLQYGGSVTIFSAKENETSISFAKERAKNKKTNIDIFVSPFFSQNNNVREIVNSRQDCIAITSVPSEHKAGFGFGRLNGPASGASPSDFFSFFAGNTWEYFGTNYAYEDRGSEVVKYPLDNVYVKNTGDYSYPSGRNVFSVFYYDNRPKQGKYGSTGELISAMRNIAVGMNEESYGVRGQTFPSSLFSDGTSPGFTLFPSADFATTQALIDGRLYYFDGTNYANQDAPAWDNTLPQNFKNELIAGLTLYANTELDVRPGRVGMIRNLYSRGEFNANKPLIIENLSNNNTLIFTNFSSMLLPCNFQDRFSFVTDFIGKLTNGFEILPGGLYTSILGPVQGNNEYASTLFDLRQTLDPNFNVMDASYGPSGFMPNSTKKSFFDSLFDSTGLSSDVYNWKTENNIFSSDRSDLSTIASNYWGCTCGDDEVGFGPDFGVRKFIGEICGATPDICIDFGPKSTTNSVTADGSTYRSYIGWSRPFTDNTLTGLVNIYGEFIGAPSKSHTSNIGTTFSRLIEDKLATSGIVSSEPYNFTAPNGSIQTISGKTISVFPLVEDLTESGFALTADRENYFYSFSINPHNAGALISVYHEKDRNWPVSVANSDGGRDLDYSFHWYSAQSTSLGGIVPGSVGMIGSPGSTAQSQFYGITIGVPAPSSNQNGIVDDGIYLLAEVEVVQHTNGIPTEGFDPPQFFNAEDVSYNNIFSSNADLYEFPVFGEKYAEDSYEAYKSVVETQNMAKSNEIPFTSDVAGMFARLFRDLSPWFSPANQRVSTVNDIIAERYNLSNAEQDDLYDNKINFIKQIDGAMKLWGDKTFANSTSTFSRVNVANLFIYLKKKIEPLGRRFLFEQNDAQSRELFRNAVEPFLQTLKGQRAITDFKVICDETNNTPDIVDSNQFVVEILIKPTKTINYIRLTMNNVGSTFELE